MDSLEAINQLQQFFQDDPSVTTATISSQGISVQYSNGMRGGILLNPDDMDENDSTSKILSGEAKGFIKQSASIVNNRKAIFLDPHYWDRVEYTDPLVNHYNDCFSKVGYQFEAIYKNEQANLHRLIAGHFPFYE